MTACKHRQLTLLLCYIRAMQELAGKHIVLGLSGGVACYKTAHLCRLLTKAGATVQVVMTEAAEQFITPDTELRLTCDSTLVYIDLKSGRPLPWPDAMRRCLVVDNPAVEKPVIEPPQGK